MDPSRANPTRSSARPAWGARVVPAAFVLALTGIDATAAGADEARRAAAKASAIAAARAEAVVARRAAEERDRAAGGELRVMTPSRPPVDTVAAAREALLLEDETHHRYLGMIERLEQIAFATDDTALRGKVAALREKAERRRALATRPKTLPQWVRLALGDVVLGVTTSAEVNERQPARSVPNIPGKPGHAQRTYRTRDGLILASDLWLDCGGPRDVSLRELKDFMGGPAIAETRRKGRTRGTADNPIQPEDLYNTHAWCPVDDVPDVVVTALSVIESGCVSEIRITSIPPGGCREIVNTYRRQ